MINHYKDKKQYIKLFVDKLEDKKANKEFNEFDLHSLMILIDCVIINDTSEVETLLNPLSVLSLNDNNNKDLKTENKKDSFSLKLELIIYKYLYSNDYLPKLLAIISICKLLLQDKIINPEENLSRLIVELYISGQHDILLEEKKGIYDYINRDKVQERVRKQEYFAKVTEIMNNFFYVYSISTKEHFEILINAILKVMSSTAFNDVLSNNPKSIKSIFTQFSTVKFEFLNRLLISNINNYTNAVKFRQSQLSLINKNFDTNINKIKKDVQKKLLLRIMKKLFYTVITFIDANIAINSNLKSSIILTDDADILKEIENHRKIITFGNQKLLLKNIKNLLVKSKFPDALIAEFSNEEQGFGIKLFSLLHYYNDSFGLESISEPFAKLYNKLKESKFITEISSVKVNLMEGFESCKKYLLDKQNEYSKILRDELKFFQSLKSIQIFAGIEEENEDENSQVSEEEDFDTKSKKSSKAKNVNKTEKTKPANSSKKRENSENKNNKNKKGKNNKSTKIATINENDEEDDNKSDNYDDNIFDVRSKLSDRTKKVKKENKNKMIEDDDLDKEANPKKDENLEDQKNEDINNQNLRRNRRNQVVKSMKEDKSRSSSKEKSANKKGGKSNKDILKEINNENKKKKTLFDDTDDEIDIEVDEKLEKLTINQKLKNNKKGRK